jgi:hypothetical protein
VSLYHALIIQDATGLCKRSHCLTLNLTEAAIPLPRKLQFTEEIMRLTMKERQALADVTGPRYRKAGRKDKKRFSTSFAETRAITASMR